MAQTNPPTLHQAFQVMPAADVPFLDERGNISVPWYLFLQALWVKAGKGTSTQQGANYSSNEGSSTNPTLYQSTTGIAVGAVPTQGSSDRTYLMHAVNQIAALTPAPVVNQLLTSQLGVP